MLSINVTEEEIDKVARLLRKKDFDSADIKRIVDEIENSFDCLDRWTMYHITKFNDRLIKEIGWTYPELQEYMQNKWKGDHTKPHEIMLMLRLRAIIWPE